MLIRAISWNPHESSESCPQPHTVCETYFNVILIEPVSLWTLPLRYSY
jgi:hypothetical protein